MEMKPKLEIDAKEACKVGRVVGVCESGEKDRQEEDDETEGRHGMGFQIETGRWRGVQ